MSQRSPLRLHLRASLGFALLASLVGTSCGASGDAKPPSRTLTTQEAGLSAPVLAEPITPPAPQQIDISALGHVWGNPEAPLQVVEFTDFGCGYCKQFHDNNWAALRKEYVETGRILWRTIHFNVGMFPNAQEAALAGECAFEQGRWDAMRAGLFRTQRDWKGTGDALPIFEEVAAEAGVDARSFATCMGTRRVEEPILAANAVARRAGVRGTPTFYVDGYPVQGAAPLEVFREFFDRLLEAKAQESAG